MATANTTPEVVKPEVVKAAKATQLIRVPLHTIIVVRGDKQIAPPIGKPFPFTADEVKSILSANKGALRKPINEGDDELSIEDQAKASEASASTSNVDPAGEVRRTATRAKAAASKPDDEI